MFCKDRRSGVATLAVLWLASPFGFGRVAFAQEAQTHLAFADKVRMVNCETVSPIPAFRLKFNIVDGKGTPAPTQLPAPEQLAQSITVRVNDRPVTPFYAAVQDSTFQTRHRVALVLVDISGSMNAPLPSSGQTRFEAAKLAIAQSLEKFEAGVDRVAIVPFESHQVDSLIGSAHFASSREEAVAQVNALPAPKPKNNTALYSAVVDGLDLLARETPTNSSEAAPESMLVLMTDGKNEILPGDDPGLLAENAGLELASEKVKKSGSQVIGVGFGDPSQIDETALTRISTSHFMAQDQAALNKIFDFARVLLNSRLVAAFTSPWPDRASLASRSLRITADLRLKSGAILTSGESTWSTPQMGIPAFEGVCAPAEVAAILNQNAPAGSSWISVLRPLLVFAGIGLLFLVLWFWVPRLVWPDQYVGVVPSTQRWANAQATTGGPARKAPSGFGMSRKRGQPARTPADATIVQARPDFSKTRLDRDRFPE